ncbi:YncE family protein [Paenirhodobacter populi]|uniref:ATP-binding protein n=1 Tax=Paenirhodobacter populi TaxID=2306993 RepID=UPI000FE426F9|nr:ATP-binding protein [Sinirhodobacter populi]RWR09132.1 ATP-binding protein [Sinirhodobacter populi]
MPKHSRLALRNLLGGSALLLALAAAPVLADTVFTPTGNGFAGQVRAASAQQGSPIYPGGKATIAGQGLIPGQQITLMRGATVLNAAGPITVDADGKFSFEVDVDEEAAPGLQPVVVIAEKPAAASVIDLKVSPDVPVSGTDNFSVLSEKVTRGLYQVAYSPASNAVFVASAVGRPPVKESAVTRIDADTLKITAQVTPPEAPAPARSAEGGPQGGPPGAGPAGGQPDDGRPALFAVYGIGVDDANGNVWVTNSRQNTVAVYKQSDLSLVKQFEPGAVNHARDVLVDEANGRAYASATRTGNIEVFDTKTLEKLEPIVIRSAQRGGEFSAMALDVDPKDGRLVTVSMSTNEAALVDLASGEVKVFPLPGAKGASGVAYDPQEGLIFVVSQQTDNLLIVKADSGEVLHDIKTGAQPLNVAFEPVSRLAYVANRGSGTITVVDAAGKIVANLDAGNLPNQLRADGKGNVWAVNKSRGEDDPDGDRVWKITPVAH